ncbi:hypothetical protein BGZ61DRAFT_487526 [Ilyonectria robusta]|uniref:uncharacterized protein n=1 Tax=Ilyonectria robusta TaxID=1079257 RepID=UPI001E8EDE0D|nr:uncharacterized protein BGZ61DRAFT_487526 [Ilyonectria robusta]KAH8652023.1 hypothetical protein BGZ61DRAFT_487526 [Ilyonectria robusta]
MNIQWCFVQDDLGRGDVVGGHVSLRVLDRIYSKITLVRLSAVIVRAGQGHHIGEHLLVLVVQLHGRQVLRLHCPVRWRCGERRYLKGGRVRTARERLLRGRRSLRRHGLRGHRLRGRSLSSVQLIAIRKRHRHRAQCVSVRPKVAKLGRVLASAEGGRGFDTTVPLHLVERKCILDVMAVVVALGV